jgi:hypothetical protein
VEFFGELKAFIGALVATTGVPLDRVYIEAVPNQSAAKPYIVIKEISNVGSHNRDCPDGVARPHEEIGCYAVSYTQAHSIYKVIKAALDGYKGAMGALPRVECRYNDKSDDHGGEVPPAWYSVSPDFYFNYKE